MLKVKKLRIEIIKLYHNILVAGHGEKQKTMKLVMRNYWQPKITKNIGKYVDECNLYQRMENRIEALADKLIMNEIPEKL